MIRAGTRAASIGWRVEVSRPCSGWVHSVFPRAINCLVDAQLWTILPADAPDVPFGLRLEGDVLPGDLGAGRCDPVRGRAGFVAVGPAVVDCRSASRWTPSPPVPLSEGWPARFDRLGLLAAPRAWEGSGDLAAAVTEALVDRPGSLRLQEAVDRAVGCGPGLTPAGDDVLVGVLAALWLAVLCTDHRAPGRLGVVRCRLAHAWEDTLSRTTDISRHLVDQAAIGLFGAALHDLLRALAGNDARALGFAADALLATGSSSGADTCVGVAACGRLLSCLNPEGILS